MDPEHASVLKLPRPIIVPVRVRLDCAVARSEFRKGLSYGLKNTRHAAKRMVMNGR